MKKYYLTTLITLLFSASSVAQNAPVDFETGGYGASWTWTVFENDTNPPLAIVANPDPTGLNGSSTVARFIAKRNGNPWAGCETQHGSDIGTFTIDSSNYIIRIMVWKNKISDVGIKLVTSSAASLGEIKIANTVTHQWEQLTFDFSAHIGGMTYDQLVVFPDFVARPADDTIYFDNIFGPEVFASIDEITKPKVTLFPNPTNSLIRIQSEAKVDEIELFNMAGKRLTNINNSSSIDLTNYEKGVYLIRIKQNGIITTRKVIKN